ncbi:MAG: phosphomethylpyrimidine synthase ThiC, partial [Oligoflexia bacterium]|nr:phosphomethylpyrimidine synthase ThiC [Oligoflexia bacterium]
LPTVEDVYHGVIAARIAAHSGDIGKGIPTAIEKDRLISRYRKELNWEGIYNLAIDPALAKERRGKSESSGEDICTMCGDLCAIKHFNESITEC